MALCVIVSTGPQPERPASASAREPTERASPGRAEPRAPSLRLRALTTAARFGETSPKLLAGIVREKRTRAEPRQQDRYEFTEVHMGLPVRLVLYAPDRAIAENAARAAFVRIAQLDRIMSDYRPDSELSELIDRAGTPVHVSGDLLAVMRRALAVAAATDGAFDPSIGPLVALWRESRLSHRLPDAAARASARSRLGWRRISIDERRSSIELPPGMRIDLGGVAKGYILQEAIRTLRGLRVPSALAEAGGDIVVGDAPPGRGGWLIETPGADVRFAGRATRLANAALATSGGTAQFVEVDGIRYSHVIDPRTGLGVTSDVLAYVIAPDGALADALATALTVLDSGGAAEALARFPDAIASRIVRQ